MSCRPLEKSDISAVYSLVSHPETARWSGGTPFAPLSFWEQRLAQSSGDAVHRMGFWSGTQLLAFFELSPGRAIRNRHVGNLQFWGDARLVIDTALQAADRWIGFNRLSVTTDAEDPDLPALCAAHGFALEARLRAHRLRDGALRDSLAWGRLRPGWQAEAAGPPPQWRVPQASALEGVVLRSARPSDGLGQAQMYQNPEVAWGVLQLPTVSGDAWQARLARNTEIGQVSLVAELNGEIIGNAGVFALPFPHQHVGGIGMSVKRAYQGQGIGRQLMQAVVVQGEQWLGLRRLQLDVYTDNVPAQRLYERFGFVAEGVHRRDAWRDGGFADSLVMGRLSA